MRTMLVCTALWLVVQPAAAGQRASTPSDAVVLIRQIGSVRLELDEFGQKRTVEREQVEVGIGSGFVISAHGYVLTNEHVVGPTDIVMNDGLRRGSLTIEPTRIEVCFSRETIAARGGANACYEASVHTADAALDLAVLYVSASNLPYIALGDSSVVASGQPVQALGFPYGRLLDIASADRSDVVPEITTSAGRISATRSGVGGEQRYLQVSTVVNPGNSGGPLLDQDGFAIGVIQAKLRDAEAVAFAIPIDRAKDFLERRGLDHLTPVRRIVQGGMLSLGSKGIQLPMPEGFADASPFRAQVEARPSLGEITLRIDRVLSSQTLKELEEQLVGTRTFEPYSATRIDSRAVSRRGAIDRLLGRAAAYEDASGAHVRMLYAILDLGREKLIARFVGPGEHIAFNEGALQTSLSGLEGEPLIAGDVPSAAHLTWAVGTTADGQPLVPVPAGWIVEPGAPSICTGLPTADAQSAFVPVQDFTFAMRVAVRTQTDLAPEAAATACSSRRGSAGSASYAARLDWLGVSYAIEGVFVRVGRQVTQLEVLSVLSKNLPARGLLGEWLRRVTEITPNTQAPTPNDAQRPTPN